MNTLRVRLSLGLYVEEVDGAGRHVAEPVNWLENSLARVDSQEMLEDILPYMLKEVGDKIRNVAKVHPRRGTPDEKAKAVRRTLLHQIAHALDLPPQLLVHDPHDRTDEQARHYPARPTACPIDGQPLRSMTARMHAPSTYQHADGTEHDDLLNTIPREEHP